MLIGMAPHICSLEPQYNPALDECMLNSMYANCARSRSAIADTMQIKTVFLITIGILILGWVAVGWKSPTSLIILHLDLLYVLPRRAVPLLLLAELSLELVLLVYLPVPSWWLFTAVGPPENHHRRNLHREILNLFAFCVRQR